MPGALDGFRVIDATQMISGPLATMILADQGADVIKIEPPAVGDLTRVLGGGQRGTSPIFTTTNRNKRSVAVNLKHPLGVELLKRLVADSDLFVQNFRPGTAERLGIGEPALRRERPDLVYVSISGFGERGPYAHKRVYDPVIQALSGLASIQGDPETGRPRMLRLIVPDKVTALTAAQAMTAALLARERSGEGQHLRLSMLDAVISFLWPEGMARHTFIGSDIASSRPHGARDLVFETRDGYITVGVVSDDEWNALAHALDHPEWLDDPRFQTPFGRVKHADARLELTGDALETRSSAEWLEILDRAGVPCAPILSREELLENEQVRASDLIVESEHPSLGRMRQTRPPAIFEGTPSSLRLPAPMLGQHTDEILAELGLGEEERARYRAEGALG